MCPCLRQGPRHSPCATVRGRDGGSTAAPQGQRCWRPSLCALLVASASNSSVRGQARPLLLVMPWSVWRRQAPPGPALGSHRRAGQIPALPSPAAHRAPGAAVPPARAEPPARARPGMSSHARPPNPCPAWQREPRGQAGLCLLHPRPRARMPAGPGHSRQQHVPAAATLLSLPAESSPALPWWRCSLQLPAGEARGGRRRCGLLRLGPVSKSSGRGSSSPRDRPGTPRLPGSAWPAAVRCPLPPACLRHRSAPSR